VGLLSKRNKGQWTEVADFDSFTVSREVKIGRHTYVLYNSMMVCTAPKGPAPMSTVPSVKASSWTARSSARNTAAASI
jgi:hypothetical protein